MEATKPAFNIRYDIIGRVDGRWTIQAFNSSDKPIGAPRSVDTPSEAWQIFMVLNGYASAVPFDMSDKTDPSIDLKKLDVA